MDTFLCDDILQEIFRRLPPPSSAAVSLVSKRWCRLVRLSTTSLSLYFPSPDGPTTITSLSTFLSQHPCLSSLSLAAAGGDCGDPLLLAVASSCPNLRRLRYLSSPLTSFSLYTLSISCVHLSSIAVTISRPLCFRWLPRFNSLKSLSLLFANHSMGINNSDVKEIKNSPFELELNLESLSLSGIVVGDHGLESLWRNCKNIKKLHLKSCETLGDYPSFSNFSYFLIDYLQELELRTCRKIVHGVLLKLVENSVSLDSLLIHDGGSEEGLLQFFKNGNCGLKRLDLRLPLDLRNSHLIAFAENPNFRGLISLRLESCCLLTGIGLKILARAVGHGLEELALINCDVVERESGLLATLGQDLKKLRRLDLSYNDTLVDKELVSMLVSCCLLDELKLRGCSRLTDAAVDSLVRSCEKLESVDLTYCGGIGAEGVELLVMNSASLKRVEVEASKVSEAAKRRASEKFMEIVS